MDVINIFIRKRSDSFIIAASAICIAICYSLLFICSKETLMRITSEDNWYENITAIAFFLAAIVFTYLYFVSNKGNDFFLFKTKKNIFFLLLALLFIFGAGEEISWGQRIFGWNTPVDFSSHNLQHETNLHNLDFLQAEFYNKKGVLVEKKGLLHKLINENTLMNVFWIGWTVLVPFLYHTNRKCRQFIEKINIPFGTVQVGIVIFINNMLLHVVTRYMPFANDLSVIHPVEVKECNVAILFFALGIIIYKKERNIVTVQEVIKTTPAKDYKIAS